VSKAVSLRIEQAQHNSVAIVPDGRRRRLKQPIQIVARCELAVSGTSGNRSRSSMAWPIGGGERPEPEHRPGFSWPRQGGRFAMADKRALKLIGIIFAALTLMVISTAAVVVTGHAASSGEYVKLVDLRD
jgi:hypothetical protein